MPKTKSIQEIASFLGCREELPNKSVLAVAVDSREVRPGTLFFALEGAKVDGHRFLAQAAAAGAVAAFVDPSYIGDAFGLSLIRHPNRLLALQQLAQWTLQSQQTPVIAVTGSLGKTTTKGFLAALLAPYYKLTASPGNYNSQIGLPLTLLNHYRGDEELLVLEMGMTQPNQISRLVEIAPPKIALITSVALVHAANFDSIQAIGRSKAEVFLSPQTEWGLFDAAVANPDEIKRLGSCQKRSFSSSSKSGVLADYQLIDSYPDSFTILFEGNKIKFPSLVVPGDHNRHNFLAAAATAHTWGLSWEEIQSSLEKLSLPERRFQTVEKQGIVFVNDSYNAALPSVKAALQALPSPAPGGKRIAVLGPMPELGSFSEECHRAAGEVALNYVDQLLCLGEECVPMLAVWKRADREAQLFQEQAELLKALKQIVASGDVVLIKGANYKQLWRLIETF